MIHWKRKLLYTLVVLISAFPAFSQDSAIVKSATFHNDRLTAAGFKIYPYNKKRAQLMTAANIIGYSGVLIGFNYTWYANYPRSKFHFFNDDAEWQQVDKAGHVYGAYIGSRGSNELWRWTGISRKKRIWYSGLSGVAYQLIIEVLDGFSSQYGFSMGDFGANVLGSALFVAQESAWDDQRIKLKFSFHKNDYKAVDLNDRANTIFGKSEAERFIKDYNAITDWVSVDIKSFFPDAPVPKWFAIAIGYGAEGMFGARSNIARDKNENIIFDRSDIKRYRQWYISPDIDLSKLKTKSKAVKVLLTFLSSFKFPAPSLEFSNGSVKGHWLHF